MSVHVFVHTIPFSDMKWNSAKDLMTPDVLTVEADWPVSRVAQFLTNHDISGAPVVDDGQFVGVISLTDLARQSSTAGEAVSEEPSAHYRGELESQYAQEELDDLHIAEDSSTTAEDVMTPEVYDVNEHTSIQQVAQVMERGEIRRVFVTDQGEIRGVITALDMVKVVASL